jgi:uncharacterized membrane protein
MPSWKNKPRLSEIVLILVTVSYPFIVYVGLTFSNPLIVGMVLVAILLARMGLNKKKRKAELAILTVVLISTVVLLMVDQRLAVKAYPVFMSLSFAVLFTYSLIYPPTFVEKIARLKDPNLDEQGIRYTRKVTVTWVVFFLLNASISAWTAINGSLEIWTIYNGFISYVLIGSIFVVEYIIRRFVKRRKVV